MECSLCGKEIKTKKEKYTHVEDWEREKKLKEFWCHISCFNKAMNRELTELEANAKQMLMKAGGILNRIAPQMEEYTLK